MPDDDRVRDAVDAYMARVHRDMAHHAQVLTADLLELLRDRHRHDPGPRSPQTSDEDAADPAGRLVRSLRRLDAAASLSGVLEALVDAAAAESVRAAVLLAEGDQLRVPAQRGFPGGFDPQTNVAPHEGAHRLDVPLIVGGRTVAVLRVEQVDAAGDEAGLAGAVGPSWTGAVMMLARHASICLERITSARTVEVLARQGRQWTTVPGT